MLILHLTTLLVLTHIPSAAARALRIMPLGDSITVWHCDSGSQGGWRHYLFDSAQSAGAKFDTCGSQYACGSHEGHSGWTVEDLLGIAPITLVDHTPDVVLIQAGTNDLYYKDARGANVSGTLARHDALLNTTFTLLPNATVLVSGVTWINATRCATYPAGPCPDDMQANIELLNAALPGLAASYTARGFRAYFHDPNPECDFVAEDYYTWGIHFSESGYAKIGASWWKHIQPVLAAAGQTLKPPSNKEVVRGSV